MTPKPMTLNTLFYGDNLPIMREYLSDESVDLIYLDPPFNSNRSYNVLFKEEGGAENEAQIEAFDDTWHWNAGTEHAYHELVGSAPTNVSTMLGAMREFVGTNQMMAYLVMMAARLVELHRVLKPTGSLYLHCDPTSSHYLKIVMDTIFGAENFKNEIIWQRTNAHNDAGQFGRIHDVILFYVRSRIYTWNVITTEYSEKQLNRYQRDENGRLFTGQDMTASRSDSDSGKFNWRGTMPPASRGWGYTIEQLEEWWAKGLILKKKDGTPRMDGLKKYIDEMPGKPLQTIWSDIQRISNTSAERLGYPTQKPIALLERIIEASSNEGDLVLDPFCGCGTAIAAAQKLNRRWAGIDVTYLSISLMKYRLKDMFNLDEKNDYLVVGEPQDLTDAQQLANDDRYQFQWWALSLVEAKPLGGEGGREGKKGSDKGVDGAINFIGDKGKLQQVLIQVKSGHVNSGMVRDLRGVAEREGTAIVVFITLDPPTRDMTTEAVSAGYFRSETWQKDYPRIQILTIEDLLAGKTIDMPPSAYGTFKQAEKIKKKDATQLKLGED